MTDYGSQVAKVVVKNCEPLYLSRPFMQDGHTAEKANGTITYVKYKNVVYGITCAHIYYHQSNDKWLTVFGTKQIIYQFGHYDLSGYVSDFRVLRSNPDDRELPDIAIIRLNEPFPSIYLSGKNKEPIDIDNWLEPNWKSLVMAMACGFPTEHKTETNSLVSAKLVQIVAEAAGEISPSYQSFLLASTLSDENEIFFSGMSGGPVYCEGDSAKSPILIGIVFEGSPGSSFNWKQRDEQSILTKKDILIRAHVFTPTIFENWLTQLNYL